MHIDPLNPSGPNDMLFAGHTRVHPKNHILVVPPGKYDWTLRARQAGVGCQKNS